MCSVFVCLHTLCVDTHSWTYFDDVNMRTLWSRPCHSFGYVCFGVAFAVESIILTRLDSIWFGAVRSLVGNVSSRLCKNKRLKQQTRFLVETKKRGNRSVWMFNYEHQTLLEYFVLCTPAFQRLRVLNEDLHCIESEMKSTLKKGIHHNLSLA